MMPSVISFVILLLQIRTNLGGPDCEKPPLLPIGLLTISPGSKYLVKDGSLGNNEKASNIAKLSEWCHDSRNGNMEMISIRHKFDWMYVHT